VNIELDDENDLFELFSSTDTDNTIVSAEELDSGTVSDPDEVLDIQEMVLHPEEVEDTCNIDPATVQFEIQWQLPVCHLLLVIYAPLTSLFLGQSPNSHDPSG
jgi:hypothetical protein